MEERFEIGQLTKELVAVKLKKMADPCAAAAELVKNTLSVALKACHEDPQARDQAVADACRGGMTGLLLADQNLAKGAALVLEAVVELAGVHELHPAEVMKSALKGMADLRRFLRADQLEDIQREIGTHFMGAGEAFATAIKLAERAESLERAAPADPPTG